jgi:ferredoxin
MPVAMFVHWLEGLTFRNKRSYYQKDREKLRAVLQELTELPRLRTQDLAAEIARVAPPGVPYDVRFLRSADLRHRFGDSEPARLSPMLNQLQATYNDIPSASVVVMTVFSDVAPDFYNESIAEHLCSFVNTAARKEIAVQNLAFFRLKEVAAAAGLGVVGKNALFFGHRFGFNCKISVVLLHAELDEYSELPPDTNPLPKAERTDWKLAECATCNLCVEACPVGAYDDFTMIRGVACDRVISRDFFGHRRLQICHACITSCPPSNHVLKDLYEAGAPRLMFWDYDRQINLLGEWTYKPSFLVWLIQRFYFGAGIPGTTREKGKYLSGQQAGREGVPKAGTEAHNGWISYIRATRTNGGDPRASHGQQSTAPSPAALDNGGPPRTDALPHAGDSALVDRSRAH